MFSVELSNRLTAAGRPLPTSNALDPGTVNTKMLMAGWGPIGVSVQDANDEYFLATEESLEHVTGGYFVSRGERDPPGPARDPNARKQLWDILQGQTGARWTV